jgi:hypothetical protein
MLEDEAMVGAVEIRGGHEVGHAIPRRVVQQQAAQHRLLGLDRLRRQARGFELRVLGDRGDLCHDALRCSLAVSAVIPGWVATRARAANA